MKFLEKIKEINVIDVLAIFSLVLVVIGSAVSSFSDKDIKFIICVFMLPAIVFALVAIAVAINNFSLQTETMSMEIPKTDSPEAN